MKNYPDSRAGAIQLLRDTLGNWPDEDRASFLEGDVTTTRDPQVPGCWRVQIAEGGGDFLVFVDKHPCAPDFREND